MTPPTELLQKADSTACLEFQSTLLSAPRPIEDFLPAESHADYLGTLCRLIVLELEHRWRQFQQLQRVPQPGQTVAYPPGVESYLSRFPKLSVAPEAVRVLLQEEYKLRHRFGDQPEASEYQARYGAWLDPQRPLEALPPEAVAPVPVRDVPGYRILQELGRGGMGVVYQAEQIKLKRMVALKMILADRHAAPEQRQRFNTEAQAVAHLHHANIVQIYDVGEHDGCPYFAMEFVGGGSLSRRLGGKPLGPMLAARLVEALARAMQHAHEKGIVHRDLKPANVLLEPGPDLFPKITDFGLAKRLDGDSGQTHTGAVMGTPSYMAPEQAAGRIREIGPLTDVYSLGAILYEALTGRPPFKGDTSLLTMQQVIHDDVPPPSRWQPRMSRDLETVCLRALAKEPRNRYPSAQALAEDLARFQAGEPIQARREPFVSRLVRKVRRQRALVAVALTVVAAVAVVAAFILRDTKSTQIAALVREIEKGLQERDWPDDHLPKLESRLDELEQLDADQAASLRTKLTPRLAEVLRDSFAISTRPILQADDLPAIQARIDRLAQRDADLGQSVRQEFQGRLRKLQVQELKAPFANLAEVLEPTQVLIDGATIQARPGAATLSSRVACLGKVQMEAVFGADWKKVGRIGLVLNFEPKGSEYLFLFGVPDRVDAAGDPLPPLPSDAMDQFGDKHDELALFIFRRGDKLREARVSGARVLAAAELHIHVERDGDRLSFQVNDLEPVVYFDSFPLAGAASGVFALRAPAGLSVRRLHFASQALPPTPSPLERADELYARGQFAEALAEYRRPELPAATTDLGQELRYKIGNCLFRLQRFDEATPLFEELAPGNGPRWPALAAMHLWLIHMQRDQLVQMDTLMLNLTRRYTPEQLASLLPLEIRPHLLRAYSVQTLGAKFIRHDAQRIPKLERVVALTDILRVRDYDRMHLRLSLARAYHLEGQYDKATQLLEAMLADPTLAGAWPDTPHRLVHWQIRTVEEYGWLMRLKGDPRKALAAVDLRLFRSPGKHRMPYLPLLVERARLQYALKELKQAERDARAYVASDHNDPYEFRYHAEAALVLGFALHNQGDVAGAKAVWEAGIHRNWLKRWQAAHPTEKAGGRLIFAGTLVVTNLILSSLTNNVTKEDTDDIVSQAIQLALDDPSAAAFKTILSIDPQQFHELWQSPRGFEAARHMALRDIPWYTFQRLPTSVVGIAMLRQGALVRPTADQDTLTWKLAEDLQDLYFVEGKVSRNQLFALATTWNGVTGVFGWGGVQKALPPHLRGPVAYVFGQRYQNRLNKTKEARQFYQTALEDSRRAPANSLLERLAQAELMKLDKQ